jgi:hypothetical protein
MTAGNSGSFSVQVSGPSWIRPSELRVLRNGEVVHSEVLEDATDGVYFDGEIAIDATVDSWFVVEVEDGQGLGSGFGSARPFAFTNAFFLDVDGGGWEPPGLE